MYPAPKLWPLIGSDLARGAELWYGQEYSNAGRKSRVESEFERLRKKVENYPSASAYNRLAELARLNGSNDDAAAICNRCIKEFPRNGQAYVILAEISLASGRKDEALRHLQNAVERDNRSYSGHRLLADLYVDGNDHAAAMSHLRQILGFKPNDEAVKQRLERLAANGSATPAPTKPAPAPSSAPAASPAAVRPAPASTASSHDSSLAALLTEPGVKGAVIADNQGRIIATKGLPNPVAELLAAMTGDISNSGADALKQLGQDQLLSWTIEAERGQVLAFRRDDTVTLAILANTDVRAALIELRARQTLIDLRVA
jgi:predicted regulator of Ras-like GTPase activity (Roadblock/LC7/MglB family)